MGVDPRDRGQCRRRGKEKRRRKGPDRDAGVWWCLMVVRDGSWDMCAQWGTTDALQLQLQNWPAVNPECRISFSLSIYHFPILPLFVDSLPGSLSLSVFQILACSIQMWTINTMKVKTISVEDSKEVLFFTRFKFSRRTIEKGRHRSAVDKAAPACKGSDEILQQQLRHIANGTT